MVVTGNTVAEVLSRSGGFALLASRVCIVDQDVEVIVTAI
jgi:hypothetical protein